jgi:hypothetical protein
MSQFEQLVESRRRWIREVLQPWCRTASRADLRRAELEWTDIAGKVDPQATLWTWAWGRFPDLVSVGIGGIEETWLVQVTLKSGKTWSGYPDARQSEHGQLVLIGTAPSVETPVLGPFSIDEVIEVIRQTDRQAPLPAPGPPPPQRRRHRLPCTRAPMGTLGQMTPACST